MLSSFFVRNYRSILELRLDFTYGEGKAPNGYRAQDVLPFLEAGNKRRLVPCAAYFGANAAGKTNLIKAVGALKHLILAGGPLAAISEPNLLNSKFTETTFEAEFIRGEDCFVYRITFSASAISEETLLKNGKSLLSVRGLQPEFAAALLSATYSREKLADILRVECSDGEGRQTKPFVHRIGHAYPGLNADLKQTFDYFQLDIRYLANDGHVLLPLSVQILASAMGGDHKAALREITDVVRRLDIDISGLDIVETPIGPNEPIREGDIVRQDLPSGTRRSLQIFATHQNAAGDSVLLDFMKNESAGTQRLAGLIGLILHALKTGGVFLVDELESSLHPLLVREIVLLFKKRRHNPRNAQLIFTTHNTDILDDSILRLSEIALVRKTVANGTLVRRLVDARKDGEDIRNVTNFRKQYLAGFYSGVPHPAL